MTKPRGNVRRDQQLLLDSQEFARALNPFGSSPGAGQIRPAMLSFRGKRKKKKISAVASFSSSFLRLCIFLCNSNLTVYEGVRMDASPPPHPQPHLEGILIALARRRPALGGAEEPHLRRLTGDGERSSCFPLGFPLRPATAALRGVRSVQNSRGNCLPANAWLKTRSQDDSDREPRVPEKTPALKVSESSCAVSNTWKRNPPGQYASCPSTQLGNQKRPQERGERKAAEI